MKKFSILGIGVGLGIGLATLANASQPILFNPSGGGATGASSVALFDWAPGNAVQIGGNPAGGLQVSPTPSPIVFLMQGKLSQLLDSNQLVVPTPAGVEFTFVTGFQEVPTSVSGSTNQFKLVNGAPNYFEIWVGIPPNADNLAGTGFNDFVSNASPPQASHRILSGIVTDGTGSFTASSTNCAGAATALFDQFQADDYNNKQTVCGQGSTQVSVDIVTIDINYFPGFTPDVIDTVKAFFNTSNVVPYKQTNPSRLFVEGDAGFDGTTPPAPSIAPNLGDPNGGSGQTGTLDFQTQADANQTFEQGTPIPGVCRVTYGGNDRNGNVDPNKFGTACSTNPDKSQNCYTFGGQVGAPSATSALGGPFGEHTHHNVSGPAGDFVFRAGTHSAPADTRITAVACKDPGACRQAVANASFKQIDFEGTGSFRTLDSVATSYFAAQGVNVQPDSAKPDVAYYFRVDMDDNGEPGDKPSKKGSDIAACKAFFAADLNQALSVGDPLLNDFASCQACADAYQFFICKFPDNTGGRCEPNYNNKGQPTNPAVIYHIRAFLTGGNIQLHRLIR